MGNRREGRLTAAKRATAWDRLRWRRFEVDPSLAAKPNFTEVPFVRGPTVVQCHVM